jgi:hypothetical protein
MKKSFALLPFLILLFIITGCNNSISNASPKEVLVAFFARLSKKDIDGAAQLATQDSKPVFEMMKMGLAMAETREEIKNKDFTKEFDDVKIGDANINGDAATIPITMKNEQNTVDFPLKKENGSWKVDFTMASMMKIGMQQHGRNGMKEEDMADSMMQHMDPEKMKRSMEMADSLMKHVDPEKMKELMKEPEKMKEQQ